MKERQDVEALVDPDKCTCCRFPFRRGDRVREVRPIAGFAKRVDGYPLPYTNVLPELAHVDCNNPQLINPREPPVEDPLRPRQQSHICVICNKVLKREDRISVCHIILGIETDPATGVAGAKATQDFEVYHVKCSDPTLKMGGPGSIILV